MPIEIFDLLIESSFTEEKQGTVVDMSACFNNVASSRRGGRCINLARQMLTGQGGGTRLVWSSSMMSGAPIIFSYTRVIVTNRQDCIYMIESFNLFYIIWSVDMKHYYSTVDGIILTHSDMLFENGSRRVLVRFERASDNGFDFAEGVLPECIFTKLSGFSEDELFDLKDYVRCNSPLIWDYAQKGGGINA
jgi:hypothetical protein